MLHDAELLKYQVNIHKLFYGKLVPELNTHRNRSCVVRVSCTVQLFRAIGEVICWTTPSTPIGRYAANTPVVTSTVPPSLWVRYAEAIQNPISLHWLTEKQSSATGSVTPAWGTDQNRVSIRFKTLLHFWTAFKTICGLVWHTRKQSADILHAWQASSARTGRDNVVHLLHFWVGRPAAPVKPTLNTETRKPGKHRWLSEAVSRYRMGSCLNSKIHTRTLSSLAKYVKWRCQHDWLSFPNLSISRTCAFMLQVPMKPLPVDMQLKMRRTGNYTFHYNYTRDIPN